VPSESEEEKQNIDDSFIDTGVANYVKNDTKSKQDAFKGRRALTMNRITSTNFLAIDSSLQNPILCDLKARRRKKLSTSINCSLGGSNESNVEGSKASKLDVSALEVPRNAFSRSNLSISNLSRSNSRIFKKRTHTSFFGIQSSKNKVRAEFSLLPIHIQVIWKC